MINTDGFSSLAKEELLAFLSLSPTVCLRFNGKTIDKITLACSKVKDFLGFNEEELYQIDFKTLIHPQDLKKAEQSFLLAKNRKKTITDPFRLKKKNGEYIWIQANIILREDDSLFSVFVDVSPSVEDKFELSKLTAFFESYKIALDESSIVSKSDLAGKITYGNRKFEEITGYTASEYIGKPHNLNRHPDTPKKVFKEMWETIKAKKIWKGILKNRKKDGSPYWVNMTILPILDEDGEIVEYIGVRHDITTIIKQQQTIEKQAFTHYLTSLPNRQKLLKDLKEDPPFALAIVDIEKFGQINNLYGNANGDKILIRLALEMKNRVKSLKGFTLYHLNADEYAITANSLVKKDDFELNIKNLVNEIDRFEVNFGNAYLTLNLSSGVSFEKPSELVQTANMALKHAREIRENIFVYCSDLNRYKEYENNIHWNFKIHTALLKDKIVPFFQPIVDSKTLKPVKHEALVRLIDGDKIYSPFFFLDIAKQTKQYKQITKTMIKKSIEAIEDLCCNVSLNLSIDDIFDTSTREFLIETIKAKGVGKHIILEILESEGIDNFKEINSFICEARELGCEIAIDDFGSGYSNFAYLIELNPDYIKIDGSMIKNITVDENTQIVVRTIVGFAKKIGIKTVAEFVKDRETFELIRDIGIDYAQGYYFSEPLPKISQNSF
ncbi:MAG: EAL domain-containing protein [Campylobacterales bacterium]|nr:EAL domain-containing protein [Campylobacterales bacterium]